MSYQTIGLVIIFLVGSISSCFQLFQGQSHTENLPASSKKIAPETTEFDRASALLDKGQGESASKSFHELLQSDLKERSPRVAVDLNNEAVALYLSALSQADRSRVPGLLGLAQDCLATAQEYAQQTKSSQTQLAVLYNQSLLFDQIGEHGKATRMQALASRQRRSLKPKLSNGLLP